MNDEIQVKSIKAEDFKSITFLTNQLGSNTTIEIVKEQAKEIIENHDHEAFVAILDGNIVGYIHCFKAIRLTTKPFIEICGLVVDENVRGNGIGKKLVEHLERMYSEKYIIRVRCNAKRELAHKFYLGLGYTLKKEQKIFEKNSQPKN